MKNSSVFYDKKVIQNINSNIKKHRWAEDLKKRVLEKASPYLEFSNLELWNAVFGSTLKRSWFVWSDGYCPLCKNSVPMYQWKFDPIKNPWKAQCPHCHELFPKNDFYTFYKSGIDDSGIFQPLKADRSLLYNVEHPNTEDPLHLLGVDDGNGYIEAGTNNCWRFIAAYLIYGQWKEFILGGIRNLAAAYILTGEREYSRKAAILLDRLADLFESFDFNTQGIMYDGKHESFGFISYWCDSCFEVRDLAIAYDQIFDAIKDDEEFITFISEKSKEIKNIKIKNSFDDIQNNIENRLFGTVLENPLKIHCNYPQMDITITIIKTVLSGLPLNEDVKSMIDKIIEYSTKTDGLTGEKGLVGYSAMATQALGSFLARYTSVDSNFLPQIFKKHPQLYQTFRFHIDTWCFNKYYPLIGDCGCFGRPNEHYVGLAIQPDRGLFAEDKILEPSMATFMLELYKITGDAAFVQVLKHSYPEPDSFIPWDLIKDEIEVSQNIFDEVIKKAGKEIHIQSINKEQWHLALLRSGKGKDERVLWFDYDSGGMHGHLDGMNIGLIAKGLDLMPDFGYPPVQYGGWSTKEVKWYTGQHSHNTVVVGDGQGQWEGITKIWAIANNIKVVSASNTNLILHKQYQRTLAMVDMTDKDSYILDVFRVADIDVFHNDDEKDHIKFNHFTFGDVIISGLNMIEGKGLDKNVIMRNFMKDINSQPGWSADLKVEDYYKALSEPPDIHVRYTDLTIGVEASIAEAWIDAGGFKFNDPNWIPCIVSRKKSSRKDPVTTFISIIEPYENKSNISNIHRLQLSYKNGDSAFETDAAIEIILADGRKDLLLTVDCEDPMYRKAGIGKGTRVIQKDWDVEFNGELCMIRKNTEDAVESIFICKSDYIRVGDILLELEKKPEWIEARVENGKIII